MKIKAQDFRVRLHILDRDPLAAFALVNAMDDPDGDVPWLAAVGVVALGRDGLQPMPHYRNCESCREDMEEGIDCRPIYVRHALAATSFVIEDSLTESM